MPAPTGAPPAGLFRRVAAGLYDSLLVIALFVIPTAIVLAIRGGEPIPPGNGLLQLLLLATAGLFFVWFWTHGGQTLGMRAWRLRVEQLSGEPVTLRAAAIRFFVGIVSLGALGLGVMWILVDRDKRAWHDLAAGTRVVVLPKKKNEKT